MCRLKEKYKINVIYLFIINITFESYIYHTLNYYLLQSVKNQ